MRTTCTNDTVKENKAIWIKPVKLTAPIKQFFHQFGISYYMIQGIQKVLTVLFHVLEIETI